MRSSSKQAEKTVLIGCHVRVQIRQDLFLLQAKSENAGKTLRQLLCEAINDLCAKYQEGPMAPTPSPVKEVLAVKEQPPAPSAEHDYISLEPKMCELCGKSFLRVRGAAEEKTCSCCEERLATAARLQEALLTAAKRDQEAMRTENVKKALTLTLPQSPVPARIARKKLARSAASKKMTIVRIGRRRDAAIANGIHVTA
jgi:hypothetical protein